tara:strand:+ start:4014 stop:4385 length:372 start_codon:yes stop_codon:yes gene_type:complete
MPRPKKKEIKLDQESVLALLQEVYNECVEQRTTAIRIQNKMLSFMQGPDDLQQLGPVIKEQQKVIDSALEKKIQLAKIQSALVQKDLSNNTTGPGFSLEDRETLNTLLNKEKDSGDDTTEYNM